MACIFSFAARRLVDLLSFVFGFQIELDTPGPDEGRKDTPLSWPNLLIDVDLLSYNLAKWATSLAV